MVADLEEDRPYLMKNSQAKTEALSIPGNAGGSRLDARSVTAVLESLDRISISDRPGEVKGVFGSIRNALLAMRSGRPIPGGEKGVTPKNFISSLELMGFKRHGRRKGSSTTRTTR